MTRVLIRGVKVEVEEAVRVLNAGKIEVQVLKAGKLEEAAQVLKAGRMEVCHLLLSMSVFLLVSINFN